MNDSTNFILYFYFGAIMSWSIVPKNWYQMFLLVFLWPVVLALYVIVNLINPPTGRGKK